MVVVNDYSFPWRMQILAARNTASGPQFSPEVLEVVLQSLLAHRRHSDELLENNISRKRVRIQRNTVKRIAALLIPG